MISESKDRLQQGRSTHNQFEGAGAPRVMNRDRAGRIMVVDDQPANLKLMEEILRQEGYNVRSFPRGRLALAVAGEDQPDLILLDITMPEMNGFEVCEQLKSDPKLAPIPVIFLSALSDTSGQGDGVSLRRRGLHYQAHPSGGTSSPRQDASGVALPASGTATAHRALLLRSFADRWAAFLVTDSLVQDQPDQTALSMGNDSDGLIVS